MKSLFTLYVLLCSQFITPLATGFSKHSFIDPTGTYLLKGTVKKNRLTGHSGEIRVKLLAKSRIALCFYISAGYPGYESGSFLDTLSYIENQAQYNPALDPDCAILFCFSNFSAEIQQLYSNPNSNCGFGKGVMASDIFEKYSGEQPIIQDLSLHGIAP